MEKDLPSNSDESDEDFVPEAHPSSEEDNSTSGHSEENSDNEGGSRSRKRRKVTKKKKKKNEEESTHEEKEEKSEKVTDVDALWKNFKEDINKMEKQVISNSGKVNEKPISEAASEKPVEHNSDLTSKPSNQHQRRSFPSTVNPGSKLGLSKILNQIGKKDKMSTLAKSQLDWNNFKKSEGIEEEIKMHNKGKDGYLDKQDFLQRTDLRQFEIEKQLRATSRRKF